jgi:hypothetical protein
MSYPKVGSSYMWPATPKRNWNAPRWFGLVLVIIVGVFIFSYPSHSQQQVSGGGSVTITGSLPSGTNVIGHVIADSGSTTVVTGTVAVTESGTWTVQPGNTPNTTAWKVDGSAVTQPVSGALAPKTACGTTVYSQAWTAVPTSSTAATSTTTCVVTLVFSNTNSSPQTVTVTDNQGSPITVINAFSIPANSEVNFVLGGSQLTSGIKWSAGGTGVTGAILGFQ